MTASTYSSTHGAELLPCACASLRRAARAVTSAYAGEFRGTGLNPTKFTLLWALDRSGPISQRKLGELLALDTATLTRSLALLERAGLAQAQTGTDRRQTEWGITARGRRRLVAASHAWKRAQNRLREQLGDDVWFRLARDLARVSDAATNWED